MRGDPTFSLFPLQSTSDMQDVAGATKATSTLPSVLVGSPSVPCRLPTFQQHSPQEPMNFSLIVILPQAVGGEHRDQGRVR